MREEGQVFNEMLHKKASKVKGRLSRLCGLVASLNENYRKQSFLEIQEELELLTPGEDRAAKLEPLADTLDILLGRDAGDLLRYVIRHSPEYPYATGYARRPFRTTDSAVQTPVILKKMGSILHMHGNGFSLNAYLTDRHYSYNYYRHLDPIISESIAFELDSGNETVKEALKDIIFGENQTALLTNEMVKGIFMSHDESAYRMIGDLLIAARLQEGLRQTIVERMDEGTLAANLYILKIIIDNDYIRFSSVVRGLSVWTGLPLEAANPRVAKKMLENVYEALTDDKRRAEGLSSSDSIALYASLWATAVHEERNLVRAVEAIMNRGETYQKIVAMYILADSQNSEVQFRIARAHLDETDPELQYWILTNYCYSVGYFWQPEDEKFAITRTPQLAEKTERERDFRKIKDMLLSINNRKYAQVSKALEHVHVEYNADLPFKKLLYLVAYDRDVHWITELLQWTDWISPDVRIEFIRYFLEDTDNANQRAFLLGCLNDKSMRIREIALEKVKSMVLREDEMSAIVEVLKLKTGSLRQNAIAVLLGQPPENQVTSLTELLQSRNELQRIAALETVAEMSDKEEQSALMEKLIPQIRLLRDVTEREQQFIRRLGRKDTYTLENGFGLFNPALAEQWLCEWPQINEGELDRLFQAPVQSVRGFLEGLDQLIHSHRYYEYEYEQYDGSKTTCLLGDRLELLNRNRKRGGKVSIEDYPLSEVWSHFLAKSGWKTDELLSLEIFFFSQTVNQWLESLGGAAENDKAIERIFPKEWMRGVGEIVKELTFKKHVRELIGLFLQESDKRDLFERVYPAYVISLKIESQRDKGKEDRGWGRYRAGEPWGQLVRSNIYDADSFRRYFHITYLREHEVNEESFHTVFHNTDYARAFSEGIIGENELLKEWLTGKGRSSYMRYITNERSADEGLDRIDWKPIYDKIIERLLEMELERGDLPTDATELVNSFHRIEGMAYWLKLIDGLDKDAFVRGYMYGRGANATKKESFSYLLRIVHPLPGEDAHTLREMLKGKKMPEKRLLEAAMYAPQWIDIVTEYLGWEGLRTGAWYFHAHMNEGFSKEKEAVVAHYSPISAKDFNDGAFDIEWFMDAYRQLGEQRFAMLYDCAKYISGGANHRRSQLFADAVLGRLDPSAMKKSAEEKRNKDHLLCYSLIPLQDDGGNDLRERYDFIHQFLKQSKSFGAQRRASESTAADIALGNLARNAGFKDVIRLTWSMEANKVAGMRESFQPYSLDEATTAELKVDEKGSAEIRIVRKGKPLKSVPSDLKKHAYIEKLKELKSELTDQYRRAKAELERSMEKESTFLPSELKALCANPVIEPLVRALIFKAGEKLGFYQPEGNCLIDVTNGDAPIGESDVLQIAHPVHLYNSGRWGDYQQYVFARQLRQPFKQVFRELYLPNADELASGMVSRRYAGHQVQPRKTAALLRSRRWTVSYEEGLQKVDYRHNVIAALHAMADWFSPSDVEAPALETVRFYDRSTYKPVPFEQIPPVLFSETMRDVDLVVSVAHIGGVDPEASLSTVEMRKAIVQESLRLLKLTNVRVEGNYVLIDGKLGGYSVHLGSGVAHMQARGALHIIPVHSQHRGRLFLPFLDEDPRTAEILSKVVLLAEDHKIKDPQILSQLRIS